MFSKPDLFDLIWHTSVKPPSSQYQHKQQSILSVSAPQTPSLLLPSVLQAAAPSSCGSFCWSCWPTSLASPSSAGQAMAGSLSFLTQMRWEVVTLLVSSTQYGRSWVAGQMNKMSSLLTEKQLPFVSGFNDVFEYLPSFALAALLFQDVASCQT